MNRDSLNLLFNEYLDLVDPKVYYGLSVTTKESELGPVHDEVDYFSCSIHEVTENIIQYFYDLYGKNFGDETFYVVHVIDRFDSLYVCNTFESALEEARTAMGFFLSDYDKSKPVECNCSGDEEYYSVYTEALKEMN